MDKKKVIEALKVIRESCYKTHCDDCPFHAVDNHGKTPNCNFYDVMTVDTGFGNVFESPFGWRIERLEG